MAVHGRTGLCLIAALLVNAGAAFAAGRVSDPADFKVNPLYLEGETSRDRVYAVVRSAGGYLWIGTDNGLKRYDGYSLTTFTSQTGNSRSLPFGTVGTLFIDSKGTLWVGSRALSAFNRDRQDFDNYFLTDNNNIWGIAEDSRGVLWVGGENSGLIGFDLASREVVYRSQEDGGGEKPQVIREVERDVRNPDILWMTTRSGLFRFDTRAREFEKVYASKGLGGPNRQMMEDMLVDRAGNIWITGNAGLIVVNPETRDTRHYRREPDRPGSLSTNLTRAVYQDSDGRIWIGTDKLGMHLYRPETDDFAHIPASTSEAGLFAPAAVNHIYEDDNGTLWFSVDNFGVQWINDRLQKFITIGSGAGKRKLSFDSLLDLHEDGEGNIWIATDGGGLNRYDPETGIVTRYSHDPDDPHSLSSNSVLSLEQDEQGMLWIGTWAGGLNRFNPRTGEFKHFQYDPKAPPDRTLGGNNIFRIIADKDGWLWLGVWERGLQRFHPKTGQFVSFYYNEKNHHSGLRNGSINIIEASRAGHYWIGGYLGLEKYDPGTRRFTAVPLDDKPDEVFDLHEDMQGVLWVATSKGLIRFEPGSGAMVRYTASDGLADSFVTSIEKDDRGKLWLGTRGGLSRFDPHDETFESFDKLDGLAATQFNRFSHLKTREGIMYFGGPKGLTIFDPENLPRNTRAPDVVLTDVELFQKPVEPGTSPYLPVHVNQLQKLVLPYEHRDVTFEFSALSFIAPPKNRYRYRLVGLEKHWTEVDSTRRRVRYTNLDPGKYQFHVIGSNNEDVWNNHGAKVNLIIPAPWWMTWWARTLGVMLALAGVYGFTDWRLRLNRRRQKELSGEIEERRAAERKLFHIAYHDSLTGLPNRLWLTEHLEALIRRGAGGDSRPFALLFLDGDRFKQINDTHGHQLGDHILVSVAKRLKALLPRKYHAIRLGGDEFTVLVEEYRSGEEVTAISRIIIDAFNRPFQVEKNLMFFKVSIGLVFCEGQYSFPGQILRDADIAMYKAKELGRGVYQVFDAKMREQTLELTQLETDLYKALERNQLHLVYQPIVHLQTGELSGFEALCRWNHPQKGPIPPDKFIPVAEESGLIFTLGPWVLRQACAQLATWIREFNLEKPLTISINLSSLELSQSYFLAQIDKVLAETGLDSRMLKLEITESTLMENSESMNTLLEELRRRDIQLAIDDFGTGYSSLSYLDQLPVQVLKIDRRFVDAIANIGDESAGSVEIVRATISLAHNLNIMVVAEGIETAQQYRLLRSYGCDFGQGYYIAKPMSADDAARYMNREPGPETTARVAANSVPAERLGPLPRSRRRFRDK